MKPIGPLMREHRLIERMVTNLDRSMKYAKEKKRIDGPFLTTAIDFFRTYADRTHHGKEEDILFRELSKKELKPEDRRVMDELIQEHSWARKMVSRLVDAKNSCGNSESLEQTLICIQELVNFYPAHILKEDKHFFYPCLEYFTQAEQNAMLDEFWEFDRKLIHEKYQNILTEMELLNNHTH